MEIYRRLYLYPWWSLNTCWSFRGEFTLQPSHLLPGQAKGVYHYRPGLPQQVSSCLTSKPCIKGLEGMRVQRATHQGIHHIFWVCVALMNAGNRRSADGQIREINKQ